MELITNLQSPELRFKIALDVPIKDLSALCKQNRSWREICGSEEFWKLKFQRDFPDKWLLKGKSYKQSYQFWYEIQQKLRPFGYYPDDQQQLSSTLPILIRWHGRGFRETRIYGYHTWDFIARFAEYQMGSNSDFLLERILKDFKTYGFDRIYITLPETFDFIFYMNIDDLGLNLLKEPHYTDPNSICSSLNYDQLKDKLEPVYKGFPDYPSMLTALLTRTAIRKITNRSGQVILPKDFNLIRYKYVKEFDMAKIFCLWRAYTLYDNDEKYPPYLYVTCCEPDVKLETWYRKVNSNNYINILNQMEIRTDDNPTYFQALCRMSLTDYTFWVYDHLNREGAINQLGLPRDLVYKEWGSNPNHPENSEIREVIYSYVKLR